jgi:hypothetical protein
LLGACTKYKRTTPHFKESKMDIKNKAFNNALNTLKALGAQYVVMHESGTMHVHGDLEVTEKKPKRAGLAFPHGTYAKLVRDQGIASMKVGDVLSFDPQGTRAESVRSTSIGYANDAWGANSVTTSISNGKIEVLRIK